MYSAFGISGWSSPQKPSNLFTITQLGLTQTLQLCYLFEFRFPACLAVFPLVPCGDARGPFREHVAGSLNGDKSAPNSHFAAQE